MALCSSLQLVASVPHLPGMVVNAVRLISKIIQIVKTFPRTMEECHRLAQDLEVIGNLIQLLPQSGTMQLPQIMAVIGGLDKILQDAYEKVTSYQKRWLMSRFLMATNQAEEFRGIRERISFYLGMCSLIPLSQPTRSGASTSELTEVWGRTRPSDTQPQPQFQKYAAEAAGVLSTSNQKPLIGEDRDGPVCWKELGADGVVRDITVIRNTSAAGYLWEDKYWVAWQSNYKELGSHRHLPADDAAGNDYLQEYNKESTWLDYNGEDTHRETIVHKWGHNSNGEKWREEWHRFDPNTALDPHFWGVSERETYDGSGSRTKYTNRWACRPEGDGWFWWGDDCAENGHGTKRVERWEQDQYGQRSSRWE